MAAAMRGRVHSKTGEPPDGCEMIIDIVRLKKEGAKTAEFDFSYHAPDGLVAFLPNARFDGDVRVKAHVSIEGNDAIADLDISYRISGECSRCLDPAFKDISYGFEAKFALRPQEDEYALKGGRADLKRCVEEAIVLSLPSVIYCREDCRGLCPVCGANLNRETCEHGKTSVE